MNVLWIDEGNLGEAHIFIKELERLNARFIHEIYLTLNEENFKECVDCWDLLLEIKWNDYVELN